MATDTDDTEKQGDKPKGNIVIGFIAIGVIILMFIGCVALLNYEPAPKTLSDKLSDFNRAYQHATGHRADIESVALLCGTADDVQSMARAQGKQIADVDEVVGYCRANNVPSLLQIDRMNDHQRALLANRLGVASGN